MQHDEPTSHSGIGRTIWSITAGFLAAFFLPALAFTLIALSFLPAYRLPESTPPPVWITQTYVLISIVGALLGGYVTASVARQAHARNVLILAGLWFVFQLAFWRIPENLLIFEVLRLAIVSGMAVLGGYFRIYRNQTLNPSLLTT